MPHAHELVIRGGTVADGTGGPLVEADIAIDRGRITEVGRGVARGGEEIDARGLLVTPGFIDIHTHYDGQATWEERLLPSSWHGVTTAVMGNCGVGFAPVRPEHRQRLIELMEGVEDIPGVVLREGLPWSWHSFGDYAGTLAGGRHDMDLCAQLAHGPLRLFVMGERAERLEPATAEDIAQMRRLTADAMRQGALGFSTSRTLNHRASTGRPTPGLKAAQDELTGIALGMSDAGHGVFQLISDWDSPDLQTEFELVCAVARQSGRPVSYSLGQRHAVPGVWRELLDRTRDAVSRGLDIKAQVAPRAVGVLLGLQGSLNPFSDNPSYREIAHLPLGERVARMQSRELRARLLAERPGEDASAIANRLRSFDYIFPLGPDLDYEPARESSVGRMASRLGREPAELAYEMLIEDGGRNFLFAPLTNYADFTLDVCRQMMTDPNTLLGLGDGGAHVSIISDASYPTFLLSYWGRDRKRDRLDVAWLVKRQTADNARSMGLRDRGEIRRGMKADLNVIDFDALRLERPYMAADLPLGGQRLLQKASGFRATIVSGTTTYLDGEATGALPGRLVRGPQAAAS